MKVLALAKTSGFFFFLYGNASWYRDLQAKMADEDLSLNEDQLLDNLDDNNGDLLNEVRNIFTNLQFPSNNKQF